MKKELFFCDVCGNECGRGIQKRTRLESCGLIIMYSITSISAQDQNSGMCMNVEDICIDCLDSAMLDEGRKIA